MRRLLTCGALALLLLTPACADDGGADTAAPDPGPDLAEEGERLTEELTALDTVTSARVQVRSGPTWGRQVVIDATTSSTDPGERLTVLDAIVHAGWDTAAFVPTDVSTVLTAPDGVALDARDLGFTHQGAGPSGLFERFGPPAADPGWRP
ncbi:hypothetical protein SAMN05216184_102116 [Georgenia satyanarayanai]|uniref:Uncharacterized protein n=1 Tax=Georgenia satyanarayanai TaxID=860221 RepID=A0A2Y9AAA0_9MICO|nr:hypothetical protein [Georgenia satyanarayanai]PYG00958.1 hypothetical protein A8987_102116 [Georgenia satyanarayanai]SSA39197.1 hypothetical protein SAMN05216184_102116 [Georgenia satyanarayanai]